MLDAGLVRRKGYFWEKHQRRRGQLEGRATSVRKAGEACMQGIPNEARVRVFVIHCNG
jgi:hypothetical protein